MPPKFGGPAQPQGAPKPPAQPQNLNQGRPLPNPPPAKNPIVPLQPAAQNTKVALPNLPPGKTPAASNKVEASVANKPPSQDDSAAPKQVARPQGGVLAPNQNSDSQDRENIQSLGQNDPKLATGGQPGTQSSVPQNLPARSPVNDAHPTAAGLQPVGGPPPISRPRPVGAPPSVPGPVHSVGAPPPAVNITPIGAPPPSDDRPPQPARLPAANVGAPPPSDEHPPRPARPPAANVGAPPPGAANTPVSTRPAIPFKRAKQTGDLTDRATNDNFVIGDASQGQDIRELGEPVLPLIRGVKWQLIGEDRCTTVDQADRSKSFQAWVHDNVLLRHNNSWKFVIPGEHAKFAISFTYASKPILKTVIGTEPSRKEEANIEGTLDLTRHPGKISGAGRFICTSTKRWQEFSFDNGPVFKLDQIDFLNCTITYERERDANRTLRWHLWHLRKVNDDQPLGDQDPRTNGFDETADRMRVQNETAAANQLAAQTAADTNYARQ
jgi:hypothetical protein